MATTSKSKQLETFLFSTVGVGVMFIILIAVYVIGTAAKSRVDLTKEKLYTLSNGTKAILKKLDTPVEIRLYRTQSAKDMPVFLGTYADRVEDLLSEYKKVAGGNIEIKKFDPEPDSDAEDSANLDGVEGQALQMGGDKVYLGLAISCLDAKVAIPFLAPDREKLLEYDISRAISRVVTPKKPVLGIMSGLPIMGEFNPMMMRMGQMQRQDPWVVISELKRDYDVKQVEMTVDEIPADISNLYLADNEKYMISSPVIQNAAREAVGDEKNAYWIARKIFNYIIDKMYYEMAGGWNTAPTVLSRGNGSCSEYSFVYISMCRAAGLPARYVGSVVVRGDAASKDNYWH